MIWIQNSYNGSYSSSDTHNQKSEVETVSNNTSNRSNHLNVIKLSNFYSERDDDKITQVIAQLLSLKVLFG